MPHAAAPGPEAGRFPYLVVGGSVARDHPPPRALLPGSFNPLHQGHVLLAAVAARRLGIPVAFELSVANVDKPDLDAAEVERRVAQFAATAPVWVTRAATFAEKAELFPGAAFVVGYDTAVRLVDCRYYANDDRLRDAALARLAATGCRVVVGGRVDAAGVFRTWDAPGGPVPELFVALAESDFRTDVSSTALRAAWIAAARGSTVG
ncbi:MAG: hypothetical protein U0804_07155 [Gemmataceae bacterium]